MKKSILALVFLTLAATAIFADINVTITNNTGKTITEVYIAPSTAEYWGNNLIRSNQQITNNRYRRITLRGHDQEQLFDIRIFDRNENSYTLWAVNLKEQPNVSIKPEHRDNADTGATSASPASVPPATETETETETSPSASTTVNPTASTSPVQTPPSAQTYEEGVKEGYLEGYKEGFGSGFASGYEAGYMLALRQFREEQLNRERNSN